LNCTPGPVGGIGTGGMKFQLPFKI